MVYNTHLDSVRIFLEERNHMLQIKDLSFEVTDEKGQKQIIRDLNLDVEEDAPAPEDEPVFSDEAPVEHVEPNIPKQYNERELRRFNSRVQNRDDDDDTI